MKSSNWIQLRRSLLRWYRRAHRVMPWRPPSGGGSLGDPYWVLVSELMLQQTQVATVIPYFERFVSRWPTVAALAGAEEQQVLHVWQGLGYYRRARHLHQAARMIVRDFGGVIPSDVASLLQLPGVGRYTAGAIASIAFGRAEPILDGNVARVLARWRAMREPIDTPAGQKQLWAWAEEMVAGSKRAGDVNQAMMELGAMVCVPVGPSCLHCPVRGRCGALEQGLTEQLPVKAGRTVVKAVRHEVVAIHDGGQFMFVQRPRKSGLWAGMWEFPTCEQAVDDMGRWVSQRWGLAIDEPVKVGHFTHITTHRRIAFHVWLVDACGSDRGDAGLWRTLDDAAELPMSNAQKRAMRLLGSHIS